MVTKTSTVIPLAHPLDIQMPVLNRTVERGDILAKGEVNGKRTLREQSVPTRGSAHRGPTYSPQLDVRVSIL